MKIGDKLIVGVILDEDEENPKTQIDEVDLQEQFDSGTLTIYEDMADALGSVSSDERIVVLEIVDFGSVSTNPKFKSEKPEPKAKKTK